MPRKRSNGAGQGISVLSLFDGIGTGRLALERLGITPSRFLASEVDGHAEAITQARFPETVRLGDVRGVQGKNLGKIDLLMGGPPCQSFSICGDGGGFEDPRGLLLLEFIRILEEVKPTYFLLENVPMSCSHAALISSLVGVEPLEADSLWVSPQRRKRLFWTNLPRPPASKMRDAGIVLEDVMECGARRWRRREEQDREITERKRVPLRTGAINKGGQGDRIYSPWGPSITLSAQSGGRAGNGNMLVGDGDKYRRLTVTEVERLQTLPDGYMEGAGVPVGVRHRLLGNAWTADLVVKLLERVRCQ